MTRFDRIRELVDTTAHCAWRDDLVFMLEYSERLERILSGPREPQKSLRVKVARLEAEVDDLRQKASA